MLCTVLNPLLYLRKGTHTVIQDPDIMKNSTVLGARHGEGDSLGTLGPHVAHEITVPFEAFGEGK